MCMNDLAGMSELRMEFLILILTGHIKLLSELLAWPGLSRGWNSHMLYRPSSRKYLKGGQNKVL